jgi:hypothetical protein
MLQERLLSTIRTCEEIATDKTTKAENRLDALRLKIGSKEPLEDLGFSQGNWKSWYYSQQYCSRTNEYSSFTRQKHQNQLNIKNQSVKGRLGEITDIVPLAKFLVSPEAGWVTAQTIFINGGFLTR